MKKDHIYRLWFYFQAVQKRAKTSKQQYKNIKPEHLEQMISAFDAKVCSAPKVPKQLTFWYAFILISALH